MAIAFTICSNNYLAQASVLGHSLKKHHNDIRFFIILVDEYSDAVDYSQFPFTTIPIREIEPAIDELSEKYNIVELNTCVKPQVFKYLFEKYDDKQVTYFDPDIVIYDSLQEFNLLFESYDILLTPHIYTPIPMDGKNPDENMFLNYGLYNLGFIAVQKSEESIKFINWWKERTYLNGYSMVSKGIFVDQLYINLVPIYFKGVHILKGRGYNMGPWNLHERYLTNENGTYKVNGNEFLKFYHFSSFKFNSIELPVHYYNRFYMNDREDLRELYTDYNEQLSAAGYSSFNTIKCVYLEQYNKREKALKKIRRKQKWSGKSLINKLIKKLNK